MKWNRLIGLPLCGFVNVARTLDGIIGIFTRELAGAHDAFKNQ